MIWVSSGAFSLLITSTLSRALFFPANPALEGKVAEPEFEGKKSDPDFADKSDQDPVLVLTSRSKIPQ